MPQSGIKCEVLHVWNICLRAKLFEAYVQEVDEGVNSDDVVGTLLLNQ